MDSIATGYIDAGPMMAKASNEVGGSLPFAMDVIGKNVAVMSEVVDVLIAKLGPVLGRPSDAAALTGAPKAEPTCELVGSARSLADRIAEISERLADASDRICI